MAGQGGELTVGVVGARGGAGASVFASVLARALAARAERSLTRPLHGRHPQPSAVLVDLDPMGGGLDILVGLEEQPGVRWADLSQARGQISGVDLLALLPRWGDVALLSLDRRRPAPVSAEVTSDVLEALDDQGPLVLDLARTASPRETQSCDAVVLIVPRDLASIAGAQVVLTGCDPDRVHLVVRGPAPGGLDPGQVARALNLPLAAWMGAQRGLATGIERGAGPGGRQLTRAARSALASIDQQVREMGRAPRRSSPVSDALGDDLANRWPR